MTVENKESMYHKMDEANVIRDYADALCNPDGTDDKRAGVFFASCSKLFEWSGGRLFFKRAGGERIAATDPTVKQYFVENYPFLMPPAKIEAHEFNGDSVTVEPSIIEGALAGNVTDRGRVARAFGADATNSPASQAAAAKAELFLKAEATKHGISDHGGRERDDGGRFAATDTKASNPWSAAGWNLTRQMAAHRSDPALAERLAKAANSRIGAAHATVA